MSQPDTAEKRRTTRDDQGYELDRAAPLADAGDGVTVLRARRLRDNQSFVAHLCAPAYPARLDVIRRLRTDLVSGALMPTDLIPVASGGIVPPLTLAVITPPPPAPSLLSLPAKGLAEPEAIAAIILPVADALRQLHARGITHRAIRPGNVFWARGRDAVLGQGWSAPPASLQPGVFEDPWTAACLQFGRGDGTFADDIYALGVLLLTLVAGSAPTTEPTRKFEQGSFAALTAGVKLPPRTAGLLLTMLATDPAHRPSAALLCATHAAPDRRLPGRSARRAAEPLRIGTTDVWTARGAAHALAVEATTAPIREGRLDRWLRRAFGDPAAASRIEDLLRGGTAADGADRDAEAWLLLRAIVVLDPLAPLCWCGAIFWPRGVADAVAAAHGTDPGRLADEPTLRKLEDAIRAEASGFFAMLAAGTGHGASSLRDASREAKRVRMLASHKGAAGGRLRLLYGLVPALPCASPNAGGVAVLDSRALLEAMEIEAARRGASFDPAEPHGVAFLATRSDGHARRLAAGDAISVLRVLADLRRDSEQHPALAARFAALLSGSLDALRHAPTRAARQTALASAVAAHDLAAVLAVVDDPSTAERDAAGAQVARATIAEMDFTVARLREGAAVRQARARTAGREVAAGAGLSLFAALLLVAVLG